MSLTDTLKGFLLQAHQAKIFYILFLGPDHVNLLFLPSVIWTSFQHKTEDKRNRHSWHKEIGI